MERTETIGGVEFVFKTFSLSKYYEIREKLEKTGDRVAFERELIFHTISSWNRRDQNGKEIPLTMQALFEFLTLADYAKVDRIVREVNRLDELEKKT